MVATDQQSQAIGLIATVQAREQLSQEDALLAGMLAGQRMTQTDRLAFTDMAATRQADLQYADYILSPANLALYNAEHGRVRAHAAAPHQHRAGDRRGYAGRQAAGHPGAMAAAGRPLLQDDYNGGVAVAKAILVGDHQISHSAWVRVAAICGIGLLGLLITILVTTWSPAVLSAAWAAWSAMPSSWPRFSCPTWWPGSGAAKTST